MWNAVIYDRAYGGPLLVLMVAAGAGLIMPIGALVAHWWIAWRSPAIPVAHMVRRARE